MKTSVAYALAACAVVALVLTIVSVATTSWVVVEDGNIPVYYDGLFELCNILTCDSISGK